MYLFADITNVQTLPCGHHCNDDDKVGRVGDNDNANNVENMMTIEMTMFILTI